MRFIILIMCFVLQFVKTTITKYNNLLLNNKIVLFQKVFKKNITEFKQTL